MQQSITHKDLIFKYDVGRLSKEDLQKYYDKLRVYKTKQNNLENKKRKINNTTVNLYEKVAFNQISTYAYLWDQTPLKNLDQTDELFISSIDELLFEEIDLYGLHAYGGYRLFFRPDLNEVIHMINTKISLEDLNDIDRIYVTTKPYPSDDGNDCYDYTTDKHKAVTTCHIIRNSDQQSNKKLKKN